VCGAERLEEWVLDVYVEGGPRVARGSTGSTLPQVQVPASSGRIRTQFGGAHGRAALMMSPSYTRPPAPSSRLGTPGPREPPPALLHPCSQHRSISGLGIFDQKGLDVGRRAAWRTHR
jgi:hypothetical protein